MPPPQQPWQGSAPPPYGPPNAFGPPPARKGHRGLWISLAVIVVLAIGGGAFYLVSQQGRPSGPTCARIGSVSKIGSFAGIKQGGKVPSGVPTPDRKTARKCTPRSGVVASYKGITNKDYAATLSSQGWRTAVESADGQQFVAYTKGGNVGGPTESLADVDGYLVVWYHGTD